MPHIFSRADLPQKNAAEGRFGGKKDYFIKNKENR